ncbi:NAD(P)H-dependent oxidoreductase [Flavobacterium sp. Root935]|uniref:NAD(P)H-dependent oxidoreductase n=1 Tax=Flavobacterium sp. Root935 TaxID=1736610 RepID=UPI000708FC26|nr:NAD(P)H-dependent oxidoreductase [Flavobacterium sp. Root935]KRD58777.1 NAD(P)H-dependent oxidoreductase [Flavobacterium sp. Root935]
MKLIDDLNWRYATKKFSKKKVSNEDLEQLLEAINLSASSIGMQTYRVFVIDNPALKKELGEGSFNSQIAESSHLLVFAAFTSIDQKIIDNYIQFVATERGTPIAELNDFKNMVSSYLLARTDTENFIWSTKQAYIGLGTGLIAAASLKIDTTPMEGFDAEKFDNLLGLKEKNLSSVVVLALGYRDEEKDWNAKLKKVRIPVDEFATHLN